MSVYDVPEEGKRNVPEKWTLSENGVPVDLYSFDSRFNAFSPIAAWTPVRVYSLERQSRPARLLCPIWKLSYPSFSVSGVFFALEKRGSIRMGS